MTRWWLDKALRINYLTRGLLLAWLPLCAVALLAQTRVLCLLPLAPGWLDAYLLFATAFAYQFQDHDPKVRLLALQLGGAAAGCFWQLDWPARLANLPLAALWLAYYYAAQLRRQPWVKPLAVAAVWAGATVWLPVPWEQWGGVTWLWVSRAALVFALALGYDLLDLHTDQQEDLPTLARNLGAPRTRQLAQWALGASAVAAFFFFLFENESVTLLLAQWVGLVVAGVAIAFFTPGTDAAPLFYPKIFWYKAALDGTLLVQSLLVVGLSGG